MGCFTTTIINEDRVILSKHLKRNDSKSSEEFKETAIDKENRMKEKKLLININILIKNLEAKNKNAKELKQNMEKVFNDLLEKKESITKDDITKEISEFFIDNLKPLNSKNIEKIKYIINLIFDKCNNDPNEFKKYINEVLDYIHDYNNLGEEKEKKIKDYIIKRFSSNEKIINEKDELKKKYNKNNYIINYEEFTKIVKENDIFIEKLAMEYLLYKMKCGLSLDGKLDLDSLNFKIIIDLLEQVKLEENYIKKKETIKESEVDENIEPVGIAINRQDSLI